MIIVYNKVGKDACWLGQPDERLHSCTVYSSWQNNKQIDKTENSRVRHVRHHVGHLGAKERMLGCHERAGRPSFISNILTAS
jgi:hypothetical protein